MTTEELIKKIIDLEARVSALEQDEDLNTPADVIARPKVSIAEFLREKKPVTTVDKALVFAVFYERNSGAQSFGTEDLLTLWRQAKETMPANINDLINKNVKKGMIAEESAKKDGKKKWYVTGTGADIVGKGFQK